MNATKNAESWKQQKSKAEKELKSLEASLKKDFNKYVDSLCNYLMKLESSNNVRSSLYNSLTEHGGKNSFGFQADPPIENQAVKYMLDTTNPMEIKSTTLVLSNNHNVLIEKKVD